jgi:hypothetical protein
LPITVSLFFYLFLLSERGPGEIRDPRQDVFLDAGKQDGLFEMFLSRWDPDPTTCTQLGRGSLVGMRRMAMTPALQLEAWIQLWGQQIKGKRFPLGDDGNVLELIMID